LIGTYCWASRESVNGGKVANFRPWVNSRAALHAVPPLFMFLNWRIQKKRILSDNEKLRYELLIKYL